MHGRRFVQHHLHGFIRLPACARDDDRLPGRVIEGVCSQRCNRRHITPAAPAEDRVVEAVRPLRDGTGDVAQRRSRPVGISARVMGGES